MTANKKETLKRILQEIDLMQYNMTELYKAISDCAEDTNLKKICLDHFLAARADMRRTETCLPYLEPKQ